MTDSEEGQEVQGPRPKPGCPGVVIAVQPYKSRLLSGPEAGRRAPALKGPRVEGSGGEEGLGEKALAAPWRQEGQRADRSDTRGRCCFEAVSCSMKEKGLSWAG